jgi:predicted transcriptional regulator of viral defense system
VNRLRMLFDGETTVSLGELRVHGIHHQVVRREVDLGLLTKLDRGLYLTSTGPLDFERRMLLGCKRVPHGVVCLESALRFHRVLDSNSDAIWMAIDRKARKPHGESAGGEAQGVIPEHLMVREVGHKGLTKISHSGGSLASALLTSLLLPVGRMSEFSKGFSPIGFSVI